MAAAQGTHQQKKNPLELKAKAKATNAGPKREFKERVYTDEEAKKMLAGFVSIDKKMWEFARQSTQIRYRKTDGKFKSGGLVEQNPYIGKIQGTEEDKKYIKLKPLYQKYGQINSWLVPYDSIAELYIKPDVGAMIMQESLREFVTKVNDNQRKIQEALRKLSGKIAAIEAKLGMTHT